jgi:hypothetical protein
MRPSVRFRGRYGPDPVLFGCCLDVYRFESHHRSIIVLLRKSSTADPQYEIDRCLTNETQCAGVPIQVLAASR